LSSVSFEHRVTASPPCHTGFRNTPSSRFHHSTSFPSPRTGSYPSSKRQRKRWHLFVRTWPHRHSMIFLPLHYTLRPSRHSSPALSGSMLCDLREFRSPSFRSMRTWLRMSLHCRPEPRVGLRFGPMQSGQMPKRARIISSSLCSPIALKCFWFLVDANPSHLPVAEFRQRWSARSNSVAQHDTHLYGEGRNESQLASVSRQPCKATRSRTGRFSRHVSVQHKLFF
jgi:hypothetical protein